MEKGEGEVKHLYRASKKALEELDKKIVSFLHPKWGLEKKSTIYSHSEKCLQITSSKHKIPNCGALPPRPRKPCKGLIWCLRFGFFQHQVLQFIARMAVVYDNDDNELCMKYVENKCKNERKRGI